MSYLQHCRFDYPSVTSESLVIDCGGFNGDFAYHMNERYKCRVRIYEPIFFGRIMNRFDGNPKIEVMACGLGGTSRKQKMCIAGDTTGMFCDSMQEVEVQVVNVAEQIDQPVEVFKLNCEGMEYEILAEFMARGKYTLVRNFQVQFHNLFPSAADWYNRIKHLLSETHHLTHDDPWVWQNWELNA